MYIKQQFNTSKAVLILSLALVTGAVSSTAVAKMPPMNVGQFAGTTPGSVPVYIKGNVIAPLPCVINNGQMVEVNFGEIVSTQINGTNYRKPIVYNAVCNNMPTNALKVSVVGNGANFDANALLTNIGGLGVQIHYNNQVLRLGEAINFTYPNYPTLEAIPVKDNAANLAGGEFVATATLRMEYQ